ncbi:MAG: PilZ domain-containing protein [Proteobacteria bacterium]|nr:PilZ domain-containing protein [Pseudomonadota bacterium]
MLKQVKKDELMQTVYVDDTNQATIICPGCGFTKKIDVTKFRNTQTSVKVKCKCNEIFRLTIEFRKHYRKKVKLTGEYIIQKNGKKGEIIIRDLSMGGIRFETLIVHQISIDDTLEVKFKLDNPLRSEICKIIRVKWVSDRIIGAQYRETNSDKKELGFYLKK